MKILILGSGSYAGQILFYNFLKKGYEVYGINRSAPKNSSYWEWRDKVNLPLNWLEINIYKETDSLIDAIKKISPTHIVDFMGQGMVAPSWEDPSLWYETNISKKALLLDAIRKLDKLEKYVRASTPEVYGSNENLIKEDSKFNPSTPYAVSHSAIDFHLRCIGNQYDFPYSIGRFANFYGEGQQLYRVIPRAILSCFTKKKFVLDGKGDSTRRFIYGDDIVRAIEALLFRAPNKTEFNFSGTEDITIANLIRLICDLTSVEFEEIVTYGPERKGKDLHYRLNCQKSEIELSWESQVPLKEGISKVVEWIYRNKDFFEKETWNYIHLL